MTDTERWLNEIDQATKAFQSTFGHLTTQQLNWKPNPDKWSIAQNVDHLIQINSSYFPVIKAVRERTYKPPLLSRIKMIPRMMGNMILQSSTSDRKRKIVTFPVWEPSQSNITPSILKDYAKSQEAFKALIIDTEDLIQQEVIIYSPANKKIFYPLKYGFNIITTHAWRHFNQAREVLDAMSQ
jgi:hypothetical protein